MQNLVLPSCGYELCNNEMQYVDGGIKFFIPFLAPLLFAANPKKGKQLLDLGRQIMPTMRSLGRINENTMRRTVDAMSDTVGGRPNHLKFAYQHYLEHLRQIAESQK
ncbi:MAG: hypothetical protein FWB72_03265 [Firmicutes bacterium]|nr:hypothetical protein [Bacillota bacterium]